MESMGFSCYFHTNRQKQYWKPFEGGCVMRRTVTKRIQQFFAVFLILPALLVLSQAAIAGEDLYEGYSRYEHEVHADPAKGVALIYECQVRD